jgi:small subunit ribosomal protein S3
MGQKVHPKIFRIGTLFTWDSKWFARGQEYSNRLREDLLLKKFLKNELKSASVARIEIERTPNAVTIHVHSARPGVIIGRQGAGIEDLKKKIKQLFFGSKKVAIMISVSEVDQPNVNAQLVTQSMIEELEKRMPYRRVLKQAIDRVQKAGARGVKVMVSGRLNGAEIANSEMLTWGSVPLHTIRAHVDYARGTARTMAGAVGVKVWIYRGEVFEEKTRKK